MNKLKDGLMFNKFSWSSRIFGVALLTLIIVPFAINQSNRGSVLGVNEDLSQATQNSTEGSIAGGVIENRMTADYEEVDPKVYEGKIKLDIEASINLSTNLYSLASEVKLSHQENTVDTIVGQSNLELPEGYIAIVDTDTFIKLGANPELETEIDGTITR
jgi:hypothetical protein